MDIENQANVQRTKPDKRAEDIKKMTKTLSKYSYVFCCKTGN